MSLGKLFKHMLRSAPDRQNEGPNPASSSSSNQPCTSNMWKSMAARKTKDRSRSPRRVKVGDPLKSFESVEQVFSLEKHMVASVQAQFGEDVCDRAFLKLQDSVFATSFSGCGFTEISLMALAAAKGKSISWGPSLDWDKSCRKVLKALHPTRCCFGDIADVKNLKPAWCYTHEKMCKRNWTPCGSGGALLSSMVCLWQTLGDCR